MELLPAVQLALRAIGRHRLRSALTLLGVTIGVAVVIVMVAIGTGAQRSIEQQVRAAGANLVTVAAGNYSPGNLDPSSGRRRGYAANWQEARPSVHRPTAHKAAATGGWAGMAVSPRVAGRGASKRLSVDDAAAIAGHVPGVPCGDARDERKRRDVARQRVDLRSLQGTDASAAVDARDSTLRSGEFFRVRDVSAREPVVVLTPSVAEKLFGAGADPTGRPVRIRQTQFTVVGVVAKGAWIGTGGPALDEVVCPVHLRAAAARPGASPVHLGVRGARPASRRASPRT